MDSSDSNTSLSKHPQQMYEKGLQIDRQRKRSLTKNMAAIYVEKKGNRLQKHWNAIKVHIKKW